MPKLTWYVNRLRAMTAAEVKYRLRHAAQTRVDRARLTGKAPLLLRGSGLPGAVLPEPLEPLDVPFFFDPASAEQIRATWARDYPEGLARLRAEADELLAGRAIVFDREITWTDAPDWHADVMRGGEWPLRFWSTVPIRDGGVKYVWELARHQQLMTLARAAFLTGEVSYAAAARRWLKSWIDRNPPYTGVHWTSALELGLRLIAWSWIYRFRILDFGFWIEGGRTTESANPEAENLLREGSGLLLPGGANPPGNPKSEDLEREFFRLIQMQAEFIRRYHSAHSSANNHLIGEAAGVAMAGLAFPWLAGADEWREWGLEVLARELPRQCYADGVSAEQAFHYQSFVMDLVLQPVLLGRHQAREIPVELPERLEAMAGFLYAAMDASGALPGVGDADDGAAILLGQDLHRPYRSLLATCGVLFNRPEFCRAAGALDEKSAWLLGPGGRARFERLSAAVEPAGPPASQSFPEGGYTVMRSSGRSEEQLLLLDHGPLGYLSIAAHGHADCLSLVMHLAGRPVLVDPGTYTYHEQPAWRAYFRGSLAHNTVSVDGEHQSVMTGPTMWGRRAHGRRRQWVTRDAFDYVEAEQDGYQRLAGRPLHRRTVFHRRSGATFVVDQVMGDGTHGAELTWHLPAGAALAAEEAGCWVADGDGFRLQLALLTDATAETEVVQGREEPPQGWVSPRFGVREAAPVLCSRQSGPLPLAWVTVLLPAVAGPDLVPGFRHPTAVVDGRVDARGVVVTVSHPGWSEIYAQTFGDDCPTAREDGAAMEKEDRAGSPSGIPWLELGEGRFRGRAAHLLLDGVGRLVELCVVGGLELEWRSQTVWQAAKPSESDPRAPALAEPTAGSVAGV